jgi:mRNA interferase MazF
MNRGELWICADAGYASKPRPMLIIQSDRYSKDDSVVTCLVTSHEMTLIDTDYRVELPKTAENGLKLDGYVMLDKLVAVPRRQLNKRIGKISSEKLHEVYARIVDFLGA